ncbi:hypothetical protein P3T40_004408 [Paraburkholderia sp. EB58]|jgi:hypothetical protein
MPIILWQFAQAGAAISPGYAIAKELAKMCVEQYEFNVLTGVGAGIAQGSCWAAVATMPGPGFPAESAVTTAAPLGTTGALLPYGAVFGNSRMASIRTRVPVPGLVGAGGFNAVSNHAERNTLLVASNNGLALYADPALAIGGFAHYVLFVQLAPCVPCMAWLANGAKNPVAATIAPGGPATLHVWYRWPYPAGGGAMWTWNALPRANKLTDIDNNW